MMDQKGPPKDPARMRMAVMLGACGLLATIVLGKAARIQIVGDVRLENMSRRQFQSKVLIRPRRGLILDRNGEPLAISAEAKSLAANPGKIQNKRTLARLLAKSLDLPYAKTLQKLKEKREFIWLKRHLSDAELARLKQWKILDHDGDLAPGLWMVNESKRIYPHGELAAHILGDVNIDSEGKEGVELWTNEKLSGKVVSVSAIKDALGRPSFIDAVAARHVKDGEPVQLTIDASLQFAVEQELRSAVAKTGSRAGSVIVMDSVTGEILAMANEPSFNPNDKGVPAWKRRNRALTDGYEPGSTMKAVLLSTALTKGMKLTDQLYAEKGSFIVQGKRISEAEVHEKFEWISLKKMIQVSSNVGAAKLALKVGADSYFNMLKTFEFGSRTNTGFPGEISGRVPGRKLWQPLSTANIGFGQGVLVTPIQMLRAYAAFANGGWLVQPSLLKTQLEKTPGSAGAGLGSGTEPPTGPTASVKAAPKRILSQKVADQVSEALRSVTEDKGTGIKANLDGYVVAGKTGTAQVVDPITGKYSHSRYMASFIGYPVGVDPKLVIFTALDEPHGVYYAGETAAPLFRAVLNAATNRLSIPATVEKKLILGEGAHPERNARRLLASASAVQDELKLSLAKAVSPDIPTPEAQIQWEGEKGSQEPALAWKMPLLHGLTAREAIRALQGHQFNLEVQGSGVVRTQVPEEGKIIATGSTVKLNLAEPN